MERDALAIPGVALRALQPQRDRRGSLTEFHRSSWPESITIRQLNLLEFVPGSLRGVHLHHRHWDYLCLLSGQLLVGLKDCRGAAAPSPGGATALLALDASQPVSVRIPAGVAHGFFSEQGATLLLAVDCAWDPADGLGCRFDDPALGLAWPTGQPILSARDRMAGSFAELLAAYATALRHPA